MRDGQQSTVKAFVRLIMVKMGVSIRSGIVGKAFTIAGGAFALLERQASAGVGRPMKFVISYRKGGKNPCGSQFSCAASQFEISVHDFQRQLCDIIQNLLRDPGSLRTPRGVIHFAPIHPGH